MEGVHRRDADKDNVSNTIIANDVAICPICGEEYTCESVDNYDLPLICQGCLGYKRCACCEELYRETEGVEVNGVFYCADCAEDFRYGYGACGFANNDYTTTTESPDCRHLQSEILHNHYR